MTRLAFAKPLLWRIFGALGLLVLLVRTAWISDDAYITFRVIANLLGGYGPRWNIDDRVQVYTDPLFIGLISLVTAVTGNMYLSTIALSLVLALITYYFLTRDAGIFSIAAATVILIFSKGFIDFSASGMENPLTDCLAVFFFFSFWRGSGPVRLSLIAALSAVTRMDTVLLFLPALLFTYWRAGWQAWKQVLWKQVLAAWSPFAAWCVFAVVYYGFLFPNTAYCKLAAGIPSRALMVQGLLYYFNSFRHDTVTLVAIAAGLLVAALFREYLAGLGVLLYLLYVVRVGGDFMSSRFFTLPLVVSVMLIVRHWKPRLLVGVPALCAVAAIGFLIPHPTVLSAVADYHLPKVVDWDGIADERAAYYRWTGLLNYRTDRVWPEHPSALLGYKLQQQGVKCYTWGQIGMIGYMNGRTTHFIDPYGLADAFLARLPIPPGPWRVGHYKRALPAGYEDTVLTGANHMTDPQLAERYRRMQIVIAGDLWSRDRWALIVQSWLPTGS